MKLFIIYVINAASGVEMETRARRRAAKDAPPAKVAPAEPDDHGDCAEDDYGAMDAPYNLPTTNLTVAFVIILFLITLFAFTAGYIGQITAQPAP